MDKKIEKESILGKLTKKEEEMMNVFWNHNDAALTAAEILELSTDRTWKKNSLHLLINSLLKKGVLEVAGFKKTTKVYARTFKPTLNQYDYIWLQMTENMNHEQKNQLIKTIIKNLDDDELSIAHYSLETRLKA